jgi:hypothetical protein
MIVDEADALDPWLHAAGYDRIEALDELDSDYHSRR